MQAKDDLYEIFVRDLVVDAQIGIYDSEKGRTQRVSVEVRVWMPMPGPGDHIGAVVDYDFIRDAVFAVVEDGHVELQETLLQRVLDRLWAEPTVRAAEVMSTKLEAYPDCAVGCRMRRSR